MGLLDTLLHAATGNSGTSSANDTHTGLLDHVLSTMNNPQTGGLTGMIDQLKAGGLGSAVQSWIGGGPNQPVNGSQISSALGSAQIQQLATKFGLPADVVSGHLAQILPEVINHLTPGGTVPDQSMMSQGISLLRSKLFPTN